MKALEKTVQIYKSKLENLCKNIDDKYDVVIKRENEFYIIYKELSFTNIAFRLWYYKAIVTFKDERLILKFRMKFEAWIAIFIFFVWYAFMIYNVVSKSNVIIYLVIAITPLITIFFLQEENSKNLSLTF